MNEEERKALIEGIKAAIAVQTKAADELLTKHAADIVAFGKVQEGTKDAIAAVTAENQKLHGRLAELEQKFASIKPATPESRKNNGQLVVDSDELKEFVKRGGKGNSGAIRVLSISEQDRRLKSITSLDASAGPGIWSSRMPGVIEEPLRPLSIRNLIDVGSTNSNLIEWIKELVYTNQADVVSEGAEKPESDITYEREDVPVRTIAHWIRATRQVLSDFPQLATLINGRLTYGLKIAEENQILLGDGTGENVLGLIPQATDYNTALNRSGDTMIDIIRHAILQVRLAFYPASGIVLTPTDWHNIELTKDNENRYLMANPNGVLPPMLWGRPVVESDGMPNDQFLVGAFRLAATLFDREESSVMVSTEDRDNFVKNMVTILCEERIALAVSRPAAFVHGSFPAGSTT
jgi:HK97 family phage major capsid protein